MILMISIIKKIKKLIGRIIKKHRFNQNNKWMFPNIVYPLIIQMNKLVKIPSIKNNSNHLLIIVWKNKIFLMNLIPSWLNLNSYLKENLLITQWKMTPFINRIYLMMKITIKNHFKIIIKSHSMIIIRNHFNKIKNSIHWIHSKI